MHKYSIIIPVRSINDFLIENISHLKKLEYSNFEVLIVTDSADSYDFEDSRFQLLVSGKKGPGEKRNIAANLATGDILTFLDDDAYPTKNWLDMAENVFNQHDIYALGGPAITPPDAVFRERMSGRVLESWLTSAGTKYRHVPSSERYINDYPTVNLFVKKEYFIKAGGFPVEFWPGEDTKLCLELVKLFGNNFLYSPLPIVFHHRRNLFIPHLKQISRYGQHRGQFARIYPENSRLPQYFVPSLFLIFLIFGLLIAQTHIIFTILYTCVIMVYFLILSTESLRFSIREVSFLAYFYIMAGIFLTHISYGVNFIVGFIRKPKLKLRLIDSSTGNYIGG